MKKNKRKIEIFCTLGPSSLNKKFLKKIKRNITLVRLNLSHIKTSQLSRQIRFIKKFTKVPICIDTEGAQIRSKVKNEKMYKKNDIINFHKNDYPSLYPQNIFPKIKKGDIISLGFEGLKIIVLKKNKKIFKAKVIESGKLENNKGANLINRTIKLNFLTNKDFEAIELAKKFNIKNFALSFTNNHSDILKFNKILPKERKIFKIESKSALKNWDKILKHGNDFLIDRGDLSKETSIEEIPIFQQKLVNSAKKKNKKIYVATNFLESMIQKPFPTRAEANDIFTSLQMGVDGVVLAAETAIGKYPLETISFLIKVIKKYRNFGQKFIINKIIH